MPNVPDMYNHGLGKRPISRDQLIGAGSLVTVETNATTTEASYPFNVDWIVSLSNDGSDIVKFAFAGNTSGPNTMTLKAGEQFNDLPIKCTGNVYVVAGSGTQAFRLWGVKG